MKGKVERKETQEIKVLKIVNRKKDQKTYQIIREGLDKFIGDSARYLRWLVEKKYVISERVEGKNYKQWNITQRGKEFLAKNK
jgi:predicted transcriptional regulator